MSATQASHSDFDLLLGPMLGARCPYTDFGTTSDSTFVKKTALFRGVQTAINAQLFMPVQFDVWEFATVRTVQKFRLQPARHRLEGAHMSTFLRTLASHVSAARMQLKQIFIIAAAALCALSIQGTASAAASITVLNPTFLAVLGALQPNGIGGSIEIANWTTTAFRRPNTLNFGSTSENVTLN